ncbi:MAG: proton-conducting transporter membrane subunit [Leptospirillia bacterium]
MTLSSLNISASLLLLILPWPLLVSGLFSLFLRDRKYRHLVRKLIVFSAGFALLAAFLALVANVAGMRSSLPWFSLPLPGDLGSFSIIVGLNPLSLLMALLVAFVGFVVARFSARYMDGDEREIRFMGDLGLTLGFFFTMVVVDNFWAFLVSWVAKGLTLHRLLVFYPDRPKARLAARKKFVLHRVADIALFGGFALLARSLHVDSFTGLRDAMSRGVSLTDPSLVLAAGLLSLAVVLKSAQFPLQGWLIQVMEAPTPVSALMHAGLIYSGTILFLRSWPFLSGATVFRDMIILNALATITVSALAMMIASDIKGSLAWSTSAQIGFMLLECGLGMTSVAVMHIIAHSLYKAHAFLSSGSVVESYRGPEPSLSPRMGGAPGRMFLALGTGALITLAASKIMGIDILHQPALFLLGMILSVALARLLLSGLSAEGRRGLPLLIPTAGLVLAVALGTAALHRLFELFLGQDLPSTPLPGTPVQEALLLFSGLCFLGLLLIEESVPQSSANSILRRLYVHVGSGLYLDLLLDRVLSDKVSSLPNPSEELRPIHGPLVTTPAPPARKALP